MPVAQVLSPHIEAVRRAAARLELARWRLVGNDTEAARAEFLSAFVNYHLTRGA